MKKCRNPTIDAVELFHGMGESLHGFGRRMIWFHIHVHIHTQGLVKLWLLGFVTTDQWNDDRRVGDYNCYVLLQAIIQERDDERERLRRELQRTQDQVHTLLSQTSLSAVTSPASRPASFISVDQESCSGPELSERNHESEDDGKSNSERRCFLPHTLLVVPLIPKNEAICWENWPQISFTVVEETTCYHFHLLLHYFVP